MNVTLRILGGSAMVLLSLGATEYAHGQTRKENPILDEQSFKIDISDAAIADLKNTP